MGTGFDGLTPIKRSTYGGFKDSDSGPTWDRSYIHTYIHTYIHIYILPVVLRKAVVEVSKIGRYRGGELL